MYCLGDLSVLGGLIHCVRRSKICSVTCLRPEIFGTVSRGAEPGLVYLQSLFYCGPTCQSDGASNSPGVRAIDCSGASHPKRIVRGLARRPRPSSLTQANLRPEFVIGQEAKLAPPCSPLPAPCFTRVFPSRRLSRTGPIRQNPGAGASIPGDTSPPADRIA